MLASPDQIIRSTATNSTCRVATTLLGVHRPAVRVATSGLDEATGRAHSIRRVRAVPAKARPEARANVRAGAEDGVLSQAQRRARRGQRPPRTPGRGTARARPPS